MFQRGSHMYFSRDKGSNVQSKMLVAIKNRISLLITMSKKSLQIVYLTLFLFIM